jgi:hypothetical protein
MSNSLHVTRSADVAAAGSVAAAGASWVSQINEVMTFIATIIAIIAGLFSIAGHLRGLRKKT